jgi:hypothetical protein
MTIAEPRSDRNGKVEPAPPETAWDNYDPELDAYSSWLLAIGWLHDRLVDELIADHDNRMPEDVGHVGAPIFWRIGASGLLLTVSPLRY